MLRGQTAFTIDVSGNQGLNMLSPRHSNRVRYSVWSLFELLHLIPGLISG